MLYDTWLVCRMTRDSPVARCWRHRRATVVWRRSWIGQRPRRVVSSRGPARRQQLLSTATASTDSRRRYRHPWSGLRTGPAPPPPPASTSGGVSVPRPRSTPQTASTRGGDAAAPRTGLGCRTSPCRRDTRHFVAWDFCFDGLAPAADASSSACSRRSSVSGSAWPSLRRRTQRRVYGVSSSCAGQRRRETAGRKRRSDRTSGRCKICLQSATTWLIRNLITLRNPRWR